MDDLGLRILIGELDVSFASTKEHISDRKYWKSLLRVLKRNDLCWSYKCAIYTIIDQSVFHLHEQDRVAAEAGIAMICDVFRGQFSAMLEKSVAELPLSDGLLKELLNCKNVQDMLRDRREPRWLLRELADIELSEGKGRLIKAVEALGLSLLESHDVSDDDFYDFAQRFGKLNRLTQHLRDYGKPSSEMKAVYLATAGEHGR